MKKILIEVSMPAAAKTFDMFVPEDMLIGEFALLAETFFEQTSEGLFRKTAPAVVLGKNDGSIYPYDRMFRETNIRSGTKLYLI